MWIFKILTSFTFWNDSEMETGVDLPHLVYFC